MEEDSSIEEKADFLKKRIRVLMWDIPQIKNDAIRLQKEKMLRQCRVEFARLAYSLNAPQVNEAEVEKDGIQWHRKLPYAKGS